MANISPEFIRKYENLLDKDPDSQAFAPLAEAYLKLGDTDRALAIAEHGVSNHPDFAGGHLVLGQIFAQRSEPRQALKHLQKSTELSPENIRAHQRLGRLHLELRNGKLALQSFKMVLLLNPTDREALKTVQNLKA